MSCSDSNLFKRTLGWDPSAFYFWGGSLSELVLYRRWLVDQLLLGFAHIVYTVKGKRVTSEYWIVSRVSVRWSSTSTIRTLMAWRSNIPQKSFLCERLSIPSLELFVFYMQMAISTTGRRPLCILCSVSVLSKMLKLRSAEGSSFRLWWMLSSFCGWRFRWMRSIFAEASSWCFVLILAQWSESSKSLSECWCLSGATRLRRLMSWCCWALWVFINPLNIAYR